MNGGGRGREEKQRKCSGKTGEDDKRRRGGREGVEEDGGRGVGEEVKRRSLQWQRDPIHHSRRSLRVSLPAADSSVMMAAA